MYLYVYTSIYNRVTSICIDLSKIKLFVFVFVLKINITFIFEITLSAIIDILIFRIVLL